MIPEYLETARSFDTIAPHYDAVYGPAGNAVMTWMRRESLALLEATFPAGSRLLEIGCGTGHEALALARAGRHVLATDISPGMAARTAARARTAGVADRVTALSLPAGGLAALRPSAPFDGAYASFGALNCEPQLGHVALAMKRLLRPGGAFVCSVMARWCPFEIAWFLLHGRPTAALRRLRRGWQPAPVAGGGSTEVSVSTRYLSIGDLARAFGAAFHVEATMALPLLLPPPYLDDLYRGRRSLFERLEPWERLLRDRWPFRLCGDHIVLVLRHVASDQRTAPAPNRPRPSRG
jgi:SAM-dependent methyltransferase